MVMNQLIFEFLSRELVVILMYVFWLMLGLVLFNSWKEFVDFMKLIVNTIWRGLRWTGLQLARFFKWVWKGIVWVGKKFAFIWRALKKAGLAIARFFVMIWKWIVKVSKIVWAGIKKAAINVAYFFIQVWYAVVAGFKIAVQFSWWIIAGVGLAIGETVWIVVRTLGLGLWGGVHLLKEGFRWIAMPIYLFYKWLLIDKPMKPFRFDLNPLWIKTIAWFRLHWNTLIFKTGLRKKSVKKVVKVQPIVQVVSKKVDAEDRIQIKSVKEVNQVQVNKVKAAIAREEAMDDVGATKEAKAFETRKIFVNPFTAKADFYGRLSSGLQQEFSNIFIKEGTPRLIPEVTFVQGQSNQAFFGQVFNFIFRLRKVLSLGLLTAMVEEGLRLADQDAASKSNIYEAGIRIAYARRSNASFLQYAEKLSREDVVLHQRVLQTKNQYVYSVKRLAIILEKKQAFEDAIQLVNDALERGLKDQTIGEYADRLARLQAQQMIAEAKKSGSFVEQVEAPSVASQESTVEEEDEAKTVDLSKVILKKTNFYESLSATLKKEFDRYFVLEGTDHLVKGLQFNPGKDNQVFFQTVFNQLYAYRKLISFDLLVALYEELSQQLGEQPSVLTAVNEATIRIMFYRRKEAIFLDQCEVLCQEDIALHLDVLKTRSGFVYSFKRLAILLEKQGMFDDAIAMCDRAINLNLDDKTQGGYRGRKERITKRQQSTKVGE